MRIDPDLLRWLRDERGLSVNKLAKMSGVSVEVITAIEDGRYRGSPDCAHKLADGLSGAGHGEPVRADDLWVPEDKGR
ncbi:MAG: helix-turn-helix transcriptional regulator [Actinobacteria bacterium]|nr:helix-turn-helix transcriptional regulator [Actinomycetota bacterium]